MHLAVGTENASDRAIDHITQIADTNIDQGDSSRASAQITRVEVYLGEIEAEIKSMKTNSDLNDFSAGIDESLNSAKAEWANLKTAYANKEKNLDEYNTFFSLELYDLKTKLEKVKLVMLRKHREQSNVYTNHI